MTVSGIDVSRWQPQTPNLNGLSFLFARATYGNAPDKMYRTHASNARQAGLVVGAYHFGRNAADCSIPSQVNAFLAMSQGADLHVLDLE